MTEYKLGRRTPSNKPALMFKDIRAKILPPHPDSVDYLVSLSDWKMLGNNLHGNCVAVTAANVVRLVSATLSTEYYPSQSEVYDLYRTQNPKFPAEDNGMDIQSVLDYWHSHTWAGRKIVAFAKVDVNNLEEIRAAIAIFGFLWMGVNIQQVNITQFDNGQPLDYVRGQSIVGGHSIPGGGYSGDLKKSVDFISWAEEAQFTENFVKHLLEEGWIAILPEHLGTKVFLEGIDVEKLKEYYLAITGDTLAIPEPEPTPPGNGCMWSIAQLLMQLSLGTSKAR